MAKSFPYQFAENALRDEHKNGRRPNYSKSWFVAALANLWRIMTGEDASRDLSAPFASFISAAWASLGDDLPEISWASQIRRRHDTLSAAELVAWSDQMRRFTVGLHRFAMDFGFQPGSMTLTPEENLRIISEMGGEADEALRADYCFGRARGWARRAKLVRKHSQPTLQLDKYGGMDESEPKRLRSVKDKDRAS